MSDAPPAALLREIIDIAKEQARTSAALLELNRGESQKLDAILAVQGAQTLTLQALTHAVGAIVTDTREGREHAVREIELRLDEMKAHVTAESNAIRAEGARSEAKWRWLGYILAAGLAAGPALGALIARLTPN